MTDFLQLRQPSCAAPRSPRVYLAALKAGRASLSARGRQIETEAAPIRYVAELLGDRR
jgi:hypothetical protein